MLSLFDRINHLNSQFFQFIDNRTAKIHTHRCQDSPLFNLAIQDQLRSNSTWYSNGSSHSRVSSNFTEPKPSRSSHFLVNSKYLGAVGQFNFKFMLQHYHIALSWFVLHLLLECGTKCV